MSEPVEEKSPACSPTTRWSLIIAASEKGLNPEEAQRALEELCRIYWWPVQRFIVRKGYSHDDAKDLTQDFFARLTATDFLKQADPRKGRFRSLVFASLKHQLFDAADRMQALKRGGGRQFTRLEDWMVEDESTCDATSYSVLPDEQLFDRDWAALVVRKALKRLADEFSSRGKEREFGMLRRFLTGAERGNAYAETAAALQLPVGTVKAIVHRSRARYGSLLRDEVTQTLSDLRDVEDEIRHLCQILATQPGLTSGATL